MKTITEFPAMNIKNACKIRAELTQSGKPTEEIPAALGEALKLEGDRLKFLLESLNLVGTRLNDLKRVIVYSLAEGEKLAPGLIQKDQNAYLAEYFPSLEKEHPKGKRENKNDRGRNKGKRPRRQRADRKGPNPSRPINNGAGQNAGKIIPKAATTPISAPKETAT